jgi:spermidine synthase
VPGWRTAPATGEKAVRSAYRGWVRADGGAGEGDVTPDAEGDLSRTPAPRRGTKPAPEPASEPPLVELIVDLNRRGGRLLLVDRVRQSYVDLEDPGYLDFEYARTMADVLDALPAGRLAVTHVGGGAGSLARYVHHTRPGSPQIMLEPNAAQTELVRQRLPFPKGIRLRIRPVGGRAGMRELAAGSADVVILDAFDGGHIPAELTTAEFFADVARVLRPNGLLLSNVADSPPALFMRRVLATVRSVFPQVALIGDPALLKMRRLGNYVIAAAPGSLPLPEIEQAAARAPLPRRLLAGEPLARLIASAQRLTDADSMDSPEPPDEYWRVSLG